MRRSSPSLSLVWILSGWLASALLIATPAFAQIAGREFGLSKVWQITLEVPRDEYTAIQPAMPGFPGAPGAPAAPQPAANREVERNLFGMAFPWGRAAATVNGARFADSRIRYAGDAAYFVSANNLKRPLKIRLNDPAAADSSTFLLQSMPQDPSQAREALALELFRSMGVPAPRTAYAEVTLRVPGQLEQEYLGLFTVVEDLGSAFLKLKFNTDTGLLLRPTGQQGLAFLGDNWTAYAAWQSQRPATTDEAQRTMAFLKLVNTGSDADFASQIESLLDVDSFLRFMAANALTSNVSGYFGMGQNYVLHLHSETRKFTFIPGDLEQSFANYPLLGSPDDLMNLRLTKPYPGENKLPDRLLALPEVRQKYLALVKELAAGAFTRDKLTKSLADIDAVIRPIREKEAAAVAARPPAPPAFGGFPGQAPAPSLEVFIQKRLASIDGQFAGTNEGFVPQPFNFGGFGGGGGGGGGRGGFQRQEPKAVTDAEIRELVRAPEGFTVTLLGRPPEVNYPTAVAAGAAGEVFVASDEQGSLGRTPNGGKILRVVDTNDDGLSDRVTEFARVDHPRGIAVRGKSVWVMHPPTLTVFHDDDGDGVADRRDELVTGLTTSQIDERGGDHTTNCVRMGIDGWLYISVGDYGIKLAQAKDGSSLSLRGGGIVRVRPDGSELELFCRGLRNPFDLAIDPQMNIFTRDNTNDGAGWDTRVSHLIQTGSYGYTLLFANFTEETMPTLGVFGNGGGTGDVFIQNPQWPEKFRENLLTADWGRSEVYLHPLSARGASFATSQEVFMTVPRATGLDMDAGGRLYVGSWHGGTAASFEGPNVGFVIRVTPPGYQRQPQFDVASASVADLVAQLSAPVPQARQQAQGEILRRGRNPQVSQSLARLAASNEQSIPARAAAIFTLKQLDGADSHSMLLKLAETDAVREFALKALTDRKSQLQGISPEIFVQALKDSSPRVRAQALISLSRLNDPYDPSVAAAIIPLTSRPEGSSLPTAKPLQNQPDPDRVIPHLAVQALVSLRAVDACLAALDGPHREGALQALRGLHMPQTVDGLITKLRTARDPQLRRGILVALIRLQQREADYDGSWWGIRPDNTGPYWNAVAWEMTDRIRSVVTAALQDSSPDEAEFLKTQLARHQVTLPGVAPQSGGAAAEIAKAVVVPRADPSNPDQLGNMPVNEAIRRALALEGNAARGEALFRNQSCVACHTFADGQKPKGPHLVDIGKRQQLPDLLETILSPSAKLAQGYETWTFAMQDGRVFTGFIVSERADTIVIRQADSLERELKRAEIEEKAQQRKSSMPEGLAANLTTDQLADLVEYLRSLK